MDDEKEVIENVKEETSEMVDTAAEAISDAEESVAEKVSDAVDEATDAVSESDAEVADKIDAAAEAISDAEEAVAEKVSDAVDDASDAVDEATDVEGGSSELDELVAELKAAAPPDADDAPYSPLGLTALLQEYFPRLPADLQSRILDIFRDMDVKDLVSIGTWKEIVTMIGYSAKTQVEQVADIVDTVLPEPLKTRSLLGLFQSSADKFTPSILKEAASGVKGMASDLEGIASNIEGMSAEDLVNPETWKGLYALLDYGLRAQVSLIKDRVMGGGEDDEFDDWDDDDWDDDFDE